MTFIVRNIRKVAYKKKIENRIRMYAESITREERLEKQLSQWNSVWKDIQAHVPYYTDLVKCKKIPKSF